MGFNVSPLALPLSPWESKEVVVREVCIGRAERELWQTFRQGGKKVATWGVFGTLPSYS